MRSAVDKNLCERSIYGFSGFGLPAFLLAHNPSSNRMGAKTAAIAAVLTKRDASFRFSAPTVLSLLKLTLRAQSKPDILPICVAGIRLLSKCTPYFANLLL